MLETGEPREVHHFACLAGYGAEAINPYLAFETLIAMKDDLPGKLDEKEIVKRYIKSIDKGLLKVMSKMGISTYQSYCGAQIFDAVGLRQDFVDKYFTGTHTRIEGVGLAEIAEETVRRHRDAFSEAPVYRSMLDVGGDYAVRVRGEDHVWTAETVARLQHAVRGNSQDHYRAFAKIINDQTERLLTIRGLFRIGTAEEDGRSPVPIDEVEPAKSIVRRFSTGAMSYGSISREAHTTLAIAMNRIGGKSNTGEGGEESDRFKPLPNGDSMRSAIKQVASGRFGVTAEYLVNSDMMQIKMAQGAKPGEGGQLPGHKVDKIIAKVRHSTPGVGLISPPPHHDIYSIEDLAQLIFDLKNVNPAGDVSVKLVSEVGVGTVAAGVSKARADHVTIAGFEGGTGASPLTSIKHAGSPWEIGLAETHQTLVFQRLRSRISVQVDGGIRTGRDVVVGAMLGADEFGFATAPLIAAGCIMMRKCHLNTCPVGVATQDPVLRKRFKRPARARHQLFLLRRRGSARDDGRARLPPLRRDDRADADARPAQAHRALEGQGARFLEAVHQAVGRQATPIFHCEAQDHKIKDILDRKLIAESQAALDRGAPVRLQTVIHNTDRAAGAMLSGEVAKRYGHAGLPDGTIHVRLTGTAGQSFGAWLARGVTFELDGEGNDYVGKGLSGGRIVIRPPANSGIVPEESIIVGNTVMYGAIAGECYFRGVAGERFAVRNSGAIAVIEGAGDHCCEYMTGGVVVVLGVTGRNFAAGMSGGIAYVLDEDGTFKSRCNMAMVELEPVPEEEAVNEREYGAYNDLETHGRVDIMSDLTTGDAERLHKLISDHARYTGSTRAAQILGDWKRYRPLFKKVMPVEYRRALAETGEGKGRRDAGRGIVLGRYGQGHRFPRIRTSRPQISAGRRAHQELQGIRAAAPGEGAARPGRALHGLRRALLPRQRRGHRRADRLPGQQPDSGLERPRLSRPLGRGGAQPALDQQFPRSHRPRLPGAVRSLLHAQHRRQPGHDQNDRMRDRRPRYRTGLQARGRVGQDRQEGRGCRLRSGGPGLRAAARARRPRRACLRALGQGRRPAALRHPRLQDGEDSRRPPRRADAGRRRAVPLRRRCRRQCSRSTNW